MFEVGNKKVDTTNNNKRAKTSTTLHAHHNILQKYPSPLLSELCCKAGGESGMTTVSITDVTSEIFRFMLYYIYGGKLTDEELKRNAKEIINAADKYGVINLKLEAEAVFVTSTMVTFDTAIDNLLYADSKNCSLLKESVLDFIAENRKEATKKLSFKDVPGHVIQIF